MSANVPLKAELVNPFLRSTHELVTTMLGGTLGRGKPGLSKGEFKSGHIMAIIGFTGKIKGSAALSMPPGTAGAMIGRLLGMDVSAEDDTAVDGLSELVNMIAGSAKTDLSRAVGETVNLSLPIVIRGDDFQVHSPSETRWLDVPFESDMGPFDLRITFERIPE